MIIVNSALALLYLLGSDWVRRAGSNPPDWAFWVLATAGLMNVLCAVALFRWKKWGFWGFAVTAAVVFAVNLAIGLGPASGLGGVVGILVLYGVLNIGQERKAWPRLE